MKKILYGISLILFGLCCICISLNGYGALGVFGILLAVCGIVISTKGFLGKSFRSFLKELFGEQQ